MKQRELWRWVLFDILVHVYLLVPLLNKMKFLMSLLWLWTLSLKNFKIRELNNFVIVKQELSFFSDRHFTLIKRIPLSYKIIFTGSSQEEGWEGGTRNSRVWRAEERGTRERTTGNSSSPWKKSKCICSLKWKVMWRLHIT